MASAAVLEAVAAAAAAVPSAAVKLAYGTAGFRARADVLDAVFLRMGMLAALRSAQTKTAVGVVVTASHNPIEDNGVKMIDADGGMLAQSWEKVRGARTGDAGGPPRSAQRGPTVLPPPHLGPSPTSPLLQYATELVDADAASVARQLEAIAAKEGIAWPLPAGASACVFVARDTRPSSRPLCDLTVRGARAAGATVRDYGLLSTPQLHFIVRAHNAHAPDGVACESGYYAELAAGYRELLAGAPARASARGPLHLDCAQGVGGPKARQLAGAMVGLVELLPRNTGETPGDVALLNEGCGAEHCQKARLPPSGFDAAADAGARLASLDGDADRLVYHYFRPASAAAPAAWRLLDGDKIATLAALFVSDQLRDLGLPTTATPTHHHAHGDDDGASDAAAAASKKARLDANASARAPVSVGVVQTAYANGASTAFIRGKLGLPVPLAKTGVKFVHHAALGYDVGVYFEANGHGTVLLHPAFLARLAAMDAGSLGLAPALARARLLAAARLINQAIGDALSDAMFVEGVLALKNWSVADWDALYEDLPSRQAKLAVSDRASFVTTPDETRLVAPAALQAAIDALVAAVPSGRAFVRPSGTEDVVRVYAEAHSQAAADELALAVARAAHALGGGVGVPPAKVA